VREAVFCSPVRTPIGGYGGSFRDVPAVDLASNLLRALLKRTALPGESIDDVILGQCYPNGEAPAIGRIAALDAGLPVEVGGLQLDRRCGSGLQAVLIAAMQVQTGASDIVIAGGVESMSQAEYYTTAMRWGARNGEQRLHDRLTRARVTSGGRFYPVPGGMVETAENVRRMYSLTRQEQDELALTSHQRAVQAQDAGHFDAEIVPIEVASRGGMTVVARDEHPRPDISLDALGRLRPMLGKSDPEATVTAGNASGQNDAAALMIVTTPEHASEHGLEPLGRLVGWAAAGVSPELMGMGPVPATLKVLGRTGLSLADIDLIELNEAFAAQVLGCTREWGLVQSDLDRVNVNGSGISLGHPVGATGARILGSLLHELRRRQARFGLETMCIGGGQGLAAVIEAA
jgi:acetyl-CoA C-acetyltransferase